jgi:ADP-ribosylglycohydrolase
MYSKVLGGLYGQALGDAWAMPALLRPEDTWQRFSGWITDFLPGPADHPVHYGLPAGRITDDTEQAVALAEVIIAEGRVSADGAARAIVRWYERVGGDDCPYVGPSTRRAVQAILRGDDLHQTGRFGDTNGASMRISPVGLIHPGDPLGVIEDVQQACIPTHNTDVAISGAAAIAAAIAAAMAEDASLEQIVSAGIDAASRGRSLGHRWIGASVPARIEMALEIARSAMPERERLQRLYDQVGTTLSITESVPAAFAVLAMADGDPLKTATLAAALSGDADTIGAMACAIAGAWRGAEAFPADKIEVLRRANPEVNFDALASGLAHLAERSLNG